MSDLSGRLSGSQAISGSLSGGSVLRGGLSMGGGVSPELLLDKADVITDTASGSIVSIPDGMASPVLGLDVDIEPIQDLHGYDNPWPAGGGKNKFAIGDAIGVIPGASYGLSVTLNDISETIHIQGTPTWTTSGSKNFRVVSYVSGNYFGDAPVTHDYSGLAGKWFVVSKSSNVSSINDGTNPASDGTIGIMLSVTDGGSVDIVLKLFLYEGSTAPTSWTPYSNICPISGRSEVNVWNDPKYGRNIRWNQIFPLQSISYQSGASTITSNRDGAFIITTTETTTHAGTNVTNLPATTFTAGHIYAWLGSNYGITMYLKGYGRGTNTVFKVGTPSYNNISFNYTNLPSGTYTVYPMLIDLTVAFGAEKAEEILAMGLPASVQYVKNLFYKDYYEYDNENEETCVSAVNGDPYDHITIQLGQTVYGGKVDVTEGKMVIDRAFVSVSSAQGKTENENGYFWYSTTTGLSIPLIKGLNAKLISDRFHAVSNTTVSEVDGVISFYANGIIRWKEKGDLDNTAYNLYLASNPFHLCYELATPVEVTLTAEELDILFGDNNIWADSGDATVEYRADTKLWILKKIAQALNS